MNRGRVILENKTNYVIADGGKEYSAVVRGKFHMTSGFPKVGDYVEYERTGQDEAIIESVLPRRTEILRKAAGDQSEKQVIAANVDEIFVVMGLDGDFNLKRLERYILLAEQSSIRPVIFLNKSDVAPNAQEYLEQVKTRYPNTKVHLVSAHTGANMDSFLAYLHSDTTAVLLGSSGAGKSTISNWLLSQSVQETQQVRQGDSRGRHTTTARQLFTLPSGGYLIDTPGMRELALVGEVEGSVFEEIEELSRGCKFRDCDHEKSSGCAVQQAIAEGSLNPEMLCNFLKLKREKQYFDARGDQQAELRHKQENRKLHKRYSQVQQSKYGKR